MSASQGERLAPLRDAHPGGARTATAGSAGPCLVGDLLHVALPWHGPDSRARQRRGGIGSRCVPRPHLGDPGRLTMMVPTLVMAGLASAGVVRGAALVMR